ncbi:WxL protein peptidoglycan domain-containing protein [Cellulomonas sp. P22]|uniref:WxL protein peptidoglycan domain-containing protein n=1 Tax=Cellulomonas sp. P22 TaxID=3373189 RepID=UPI0037AC356C
MTARRTPFAPVRTVLTTLLVLLAAAAAVVGAAGPAAAEDVTWTVRTASNGFGSDRTGFTYGVDPGASVTDALVVANHGTAPLELAVYAADGYTTASGQLDLLTPDLASTGVGAWIATGTDAVTVEPGATVELPFTLTVPDDAIPGDYAGGVLTSLVQADEPQGITVDRRLGIRVDVRVGGELAPSLAVEDVRVAYSGTVNPAGAGDASVTYTLHNTGNSLVSALTQVTVSGPFGLLQVDAGDIEAPPQLLPGERWTVTVPVAGVWPAVRLGADVAATPTVTDASGSTSALAPVVGTASTWAVPWTLLVVVLLVVAAAVLVPRLVRSRRRARAAADEQRVQERVDAALREREASGSPAPAAHDALAFAQQGHEDGIGRPADS